MSVSNMSARNLTGDKHGMRNINVRFMGGSPGDVSEEPVT